MLELLLWWFCPHMLMGNSWGFVATFWCDELEQPVLGGFLSQAVIYTTLYMIDMWQKKNMSEWGPCFDSYFSILCSYFCCVFSSSDYMWLSFTIWIEHSVIPWLHFLLAPRWNIVNQDDTWSSTFRSGYERQCSSHELLPKWEVGIESRSVASMCFGASIRLFLSERSLTSCCLSNIVIHQVFKYWVRASVCFVIY